MPPDLWSLYVLMLRCRLFEEATAQLPEKTAIDGYYILQPPQTESRGTEKEVKTTAITGEIRAIAGEVVG